MAHQRIQALRIGRAATDENQSVVTDHEEVEPVGLQGPVAVGGAEIWVGVEGVFEGGGLVGAGREQLQEGVAVADDFYGA
jgi:hypothetical protein